MHAFAQSGSCGVDEKENGEIYAYGVDNAAGVAVATSVLTDVVSSGAPVNVSVLYTSGEEAGFVGLLDGIAHLATEAGSRMAKWTWIVVDSSDQGKSRVCRIDQWLAEVERPQVEPALFEEDSSAPAETQLRCPLRCAAVRRGDRSHYFEPATARMLYQAGLQARQKHQQAVNRHSRPTGILTAGGWGSAASLREGFARRTSCSVSGTWPTLNGVTPDFMIHLPV